MLSQTGGVEAAPITMNLLDTITVPSNGGSGKIELLQGDLSSIPQEHAVDVLVVSAFPNRYQPTSTSLIGALDRQGISLGKLAENKEVDLRAYASCWLSQPVDTPTKDHHFDRVLCFEPLSRGHPPELVGDIFRAITPFTGSNPPLKSVALPIVAAGEQGYSIADMLNPLIDAAHHWMSAGLPLEVIKIVAHGESNIKEAAAIFAERKKSLLKKREQANQQRSYEVFLSYSRKDEKAAKQILDALNQREISVFFDEISIDKGTSWQQKIFDALEACQRVVAIYSPSFLASKVCLEEFNIAWARGRNEASQILFPILWEPTTLPTYMQLINYVDCSAKGPSAIESACDRLMNELGK